MPSSLPARSIERSSGNSLREAMDLEETELIQSPHSARRVGALNARNSEGSAFRRMDSRPRFFESAQPLPQAMVGDQPLGVPAGQAAAHVFPGATWELPLPRPGPVREPIEA